MKSLFTITCLLWLGCLIALGQPKNLKAETVLSSLQINLSWTDNTSSETKFEIERSPYSTNEFKVIGSVAKNVVTYQDKDPSKSPVTRYKYRVRGIWDGGWFGPDATAYSNVADAWTGSRPKPPVVTKRTEIWTSNSEKLAGVKLEWADFADDEIGYYVSYKKYGSSAYTNIALGANTRSYEIRVPENEAWPGCNAKIEFIVMCYNLAGSTEATDKVFNASSVRKPDTPQNLKASSNPKTDTEPKVTLSWDGANNTESVESSFTIEFATTPDFNGSKTVAQRANLGSLELDRLSGIGYGATYYFRIRANNCAGNSDWSNTVSATTPAGPPPTAPIIDGSLLQNWTKNSDRVTEITALWQDKSNNETGFDIQWGDNDQYTGGSASVGANVTNYKIEGSWPGCGHKVYVRVRAKNTSGESAWSATTVTTSIAIPEPPNNVVATVKSSSEVELKWGGANESYSRESYFVIQYSNSHEPTETSGVSVTVAQNTSSTVLNVGVNTQYYMRIKAVNCVGNSGWSTLVPVKTPAGTYAAPTDLLAVATSQTVAELSWKYKTLPGFVITFDVQRSDNGGAAFNSLPVGTLSFTTNASGEISGKYTNTGLTAGATYQFRVRAKIPYESEFSKVFSITMPAPVIPKPAAPTNLVATAVNSTEINLTWIDNATNEVGFTVERSTDQTNWTTQGDAGADSKNFTATNLSPSTKYYFRVFSRNLGGNSDWSNVAEATTHAPPVTVTKPTAPTNLKATASGTTQIDLTWTDASTNEEGFEIERSADNVTWGNSASVGANTVSFASTGLTASSKYYFRVRAKNSAGPSDWSNVADATTDATSTTTLTAPSNLTVTLVNNTALLVWQDNTSNETGFQVERSVNGANFEKLAELGANVFLYKDENLRAQSTYAYRVRAYRAMTMSDYSNTVEIKFVVTALGPLPAEVRIYPNPTTNTLNYVVGSGAYPDLLRIRDVSGRLQQEMMPTGRASVIEVPVDQLSTGTYYLEVMTSQKPKFFRFVKQ